MTPAPSKLLDLTGTHYLITGAASGIGRAIAELFATLGAQLSLVDKDGAQLAAVANTMGIARVAHHVFDLEDVDHIDDLVKRIVAADGPLHGIVHCAGVQTIMPARDIKPETWRRILAVNCEAALALSKNMGKRRVYAGGGGAVIFISSIMALAGNAGSTAYSMSKAALHGLARSLAIELAPSRIRVNCIAPGFVRTPMLERLQQTRDDAQFKAIEALHPLGFGEAVDIAHAAAFLAAETGRWITGTVLIVDGGYLAQ